MPSSLSPFTSLGFSDCHLYNIPVLCTCVTISTCTKDITSQETEASNYVNEFKGQKCESTVIKITTSSLFQLGQIAKGWKNRICMTKLLWFR